MYTTYVFRRLGLWVVAILVTALLNPSLAQFQDLNAGLTGVGDASVGWADYDLDGDPDVLISGHTGSGPLTTLYENTGGSFTAVPNLPFINVSLGEVAWGDYDNDGDPDLVLTGEMGQWYGYYPDVSKQRKWYIYGCKCGHQGNGRKHGCLG